MTEKKGQFLLIKAHALNARVKGNAKQLKRSLSAAARHNTREFDEPDSDIDPTLTKRNTTLLGLPNSSAGILALKEAVHKEWGIESVRVDQTIAVEVVVSLRRTPNGISEDAYFAGAAKWAETWYGGRIISAMVHRDQAYPHAHIIILLNIGKGRPSGSKQIGYKKEANEMKLAFASAYSNQYGVYLPPPKLTGAERRDASRQVHQYMMANHYPAVSDPPGRFCQRLSTQTLPELPARLGMNWRQCQFCASWLRALSKVQGARGQGPQGKRPSARLLPL